MTSQFQRTGLPCTILFVDVCGSSKIYETLGNARAQAVIAKSLGLLSQCVTDHQGTVVKNIGDELMCTFSVAHDAAAAEISAHVAIEPEARDEPAPPKKPRRNPGAKTAENIVSVLGPRAPPDSSR